MDEPGTRGALRTYTLGALRAELIGVAAVVAFFVTNGMPGARSGRSNAGFISEISLGLAVVALWIGSVGFLRSVRMRRLLQAYPWTERDALYRIGVTGNNGQPALIIYGTGADDGAEEVYSVSTTVWRYKKIPEGHGSLLVIENPKWAVISPPDQSLIAVAKRPRLTWWRDRLYRFATEEGGGSSGPI